MKEIILSNLNIIEQRIANACREYNRDPSEVKLLLATKTVSADNIKIAIEAGYPLIGENKVQEIKQKYEILNTVPHRKHFIGHLQTNKIKDILKHDVTCIESLDRLDLAEKLHQHLDRRQMKIDVFIQINTSNEESKFGIKPEEAEPFIRAVAKFPTIQIKGLMTIGLFSAETEKVRPCFQMLKTIQKHITTLNIPNVELKELSMGMSNDLEVAIEEGATILRIGTAIFGQRIYPDSYYWNENNN
ncbi:YggS family pyridoxal phosphate-dependent enzyme [Myroides pelagicus]|uniref:Pyridoxal phosphate homeostasis protein n=1 Tax=Myroides pelagicus TaxID=270914 RepID=A0A7K1GJL9_9FLAO|nr:YggS family pyridoxal phosphate-dependent enzyme [Myroides pelagicus]MEC4113821.1 YggS family pyridoxal phosphate-dependent enzyme [Myroides pelagicus]MTH29071.1 YggS family pyridoxal phosphate-dependent enzyme [Myroides pelagicus]